MPVITNPNPIYITKLIIMSKELSAHIAFFFIAITQLALSAFIFRLAPPFKIIILVIIIILEIRFLAHSYTVSTMLIYPLRKFNKHAFFHTNN